MPPARTDRVPRAGRRAIVVLSLATTLLAFGPAIFAQASPPPAAAAAAEAPKAEDEAAKLEAKRRDTIRYGIDSEIGDLLDKLSSEKEGRYNDELLALLKSSRSSKLRTSILDFLAGLEWKGAEDLALGLVEDRDNAEPDLVVSSLSYLAAIRSKKALALSDKIIKEDNKKLLPSLVRLMGRAGGENEEKLLLEWFDGDTATPALKEEAIKALGEIGSSKAAARLATLASDPEGGKAARMFACAALAKIKDEAAVPSLVKAANDADPNVRSYAIEALGAFAQLKTKSGDAAQGALVEALRDSYAKARISACKAAAAGKVSAAVPFLRYKAQSDPEKAVKSEACRSLALLGVDIKGDDGPFAFLRGRLTDKKESGDIRVLCFGLLGRYDADSSMPALEKLLKDEASEKDRSFYTSLAREVANSDKSPGIVVLARILASDKEYLIRVAAIEWGRKTKAGDFKADIERMAKDDPSDQIRRRAADALKSY
jgi:HEAT repeat protein